jgi:hypothetical protein
MKQMLLSADPAERKGLPITTGVLDYFPLAIAEVARVSKAGNDQHNPGQPLHWDRTKSLDHADCIARHLVDRGSRDADGQRHSAKLAWRALALLQTELELEAEAQRKTEVVFHGCDDRVQVVSTKELTAVERLARMCGKEFA